MPKSGGWEGEKTTQMKDESKKCCLGCLNQASESGKKQQKWVKMVKIVVSYAWIKRLKVAKKMDKKQKIVAEGSKIEDKVAKIMQKIKK